MTGRDALAAFIMAHEDQIRAVARRKLTQATRLVYDSEEVLSSVLRRLDALAHRGGLVPSNEHELLAFIKAVARNTAVSRTRLIEFMRNRLTEDGPYAYELLKRLNACQDDDEATVLLNRMMLSLKDATDRQMLALVHKGATHKAIADLLKLPSVEASRQRWMRIRRQLCEAFEGGQLR